MMCELLKKLSIAIIDFWYGEEKEECQCKCCTNKKSN